MKSREVETILRRYGFELASQKGSHRKWRSIDSNLQVIVPAHAEKDIPIGTLRNILKALRFLIRSGERSHFPLR